ncbi:glycerol-3-phosphate acyltransferase 4 isoform X1 [Cryptotermes secundus]|uniref:glycerol-3-phosphate acyltransferase 4 isoform X1 n=1 Tax=Cryptotermes secundus TaxID=105785 RepID=UPI000CD7DD34|nr:glycerol-3-phosphate acyltransferase 4 isoform X1 [Cryptotermes secundus]
MALIWSVVSVSCSILVMPFLMFLLAIIFLASIGKSLGVRRLYVKMLLKIFEYGRENIEIAKKDRHTSCDNSENEDEDDVEGQRDKEKGSSNVTCHYLNHSNHMLHKMDRKLKNGVLANNSTSVISREDLILVPDPEQNYTSASTVNSEGDHTAVIHNFPRRRSFETLKREFELSDCLNFVKAGVEAIIEDQVTHRFEAEELKSWNLLTRTNLHYEFISWRLSFIWMVGFLMRYCFLLPVRVLICFIGTVWIVMAMLLIGLVPDGHMKRWLHKHAYLITFRILARSLSAIITVHNKQYMPSGGVCVANHTSPIDIVMLSTENCFSLVMWLTICTGIVGYVREGKFKRWLNYHVSIMCFGVLSSALSAVITYHNTENRPKCGICVANHTSPIDVLVLACDNCYALIGQRHGGFLGILQRALARASPHIWFERSEVKDREAVAKRLRQHVSDPRNPPILIFPEGTCINNTSVMQFKKGSFEVGSVIYPVAIKYDPKFGDAFWNSSRYSMMQYLYLMMTSWAIVCDVWYLPPMYQQEGESAIDFANRVKSAIARQGGLVDLMWDGQLKRMKAKPEWKEKQQEEFSKRLKIDTKKQE